MKEADCIPFRSCCDNHYSLELGLMNDNDDSNLFTDQKHRYIIHKRLSCDDAAKKEILKPRKQRLQEDRSRPACLQKDK